MRKMDVLGQRLSKRPQDIIGEPKAATFLVFTSLLG